MVAHVADQRLDCEMAIFRGGIKEIGWAARKRRIDIIFPAQRVERPRIAHGGRHTLKGRIAVEDWLAHPVGHINHEFAIERPSVGSDRRIHRLTWNGEYDDLCALNR